MRIFRKCLVAQVAVACLLTFVPFVSAGEGEWKTRLKAELETIYRPTEKTFLGRSTSQGSILVIQKEGIQGDIPKGTIALNSVRDGRLVMQGGGGLFSSGGRSFRPAERVLLTKLKITDDSVRLFVETVDTADVIVSKKNVWGKKMPGETQATKFTAGISFEFPAGYLQTASGKDVLSAIRPWLVTEEEAAAEPAKTIRLGQSAEEVIAILGKPEKQVQLGGKTILVYKDMKVVLQDGKVTDVQ